MTTLAASDFMMRLLDPERDGPHLHAIFGDEESCRYMSHPPLASAAETVALLTEWTKSCPDTSWALADAPDGPALGRISIYPRGKNNVWDIACMIAPSARGRGIARRASAMAIDHVFAHKGARRIVADIDPDNSPSIRTFERLGFTREGYLRAEWEMHIGIRDSAIFGLLKDDPRPWRA
jgi:[ribosomal protein S5]-alanine N-acetyltransferase